MMPGELLAIVGESGSGKSVTALSMLQLLPQKTRISGEIIFQNNDSAIDLLKCTGNQINAIRGNKISMIFQEPMTSLNPVLTCGSQVIESLMQHKGTGKKQARELTMQLFEKVGLPAPSATVDRYPHQLSGGQKQRVMIAMAMSCDPALLIADEPTTALDVTVQKNVLQLIRNLQLQNQMGVIFITHDLGLVADIADHVAVMYKGEIVEKGPVSQILKSPQHPYTKALIACRPTGKNKGYPLPVVSDFLDQADLKIVEPKPVSIASYEMISEQPVLQIRDLVVSFPMKKNLFGKVITQFNAVDHVSFDVRKGEIVGLVGESGCGKTTLGRAILQLIPISSGEILFKGKSIVNEARSLSKQIRKDLQIVFQDPYGSLNPRISIGNAILEPLKVHHLLHGKNEQRERVIDLLEKVGLKPDHFKRYPHQFSGGQRQRICIARALALDPSFLVFDESVSALDVSVQAQVLNLVNELKDQFHFTSIFISHDLSVVHYISDHILVMNKGKIVEEGTADKVFNRPEDNYTKQLIEAIPGKNIA